MLIFIEAIGWSADILFLLAYFLISTGRLKGEDRSYNLMNLGGAMLYGSYAILKHAPPVLILEILWGGIAARAIYKTFRSRRSVAS